MVQAFNPRILEAEVGESLSSRPAWNIEQVPGKPGLHRETVLGGKKTSRVAKTW